jgi:hypothetical protein
MSVDEDEYYNEDKKTPTEKIEEDMDMMKVDDDFINVEEDKYETISISMFSQKH